MSTTRDEFEKWASTRPYQLSKTGDEYKYMATQHAWLGWQASRDAMCIYFPPTPEFGAQDHPADGYEEALIHVGLILDNYGVKHE